MRSHWKLLVVLAVQLTILVAIPVRKIRARAVGAEVTLATRPVDPYDLLSGYYVILAYDIERPDPSIVAPDLEYGDRVWLDLEPAGEAWTLVRVGKERHSEIAIRAIWRGQPELSGMGRLYIPEAERQEVDLLMREAAGRALVDVKVDGSGEAAILRLRVGGRSFGETR